MEDSEEVPATTTKKIKILKKETLLRKLESDRRRSQTWINTALSAEAGVKRDPVFASLLLLDCYVTCMKIKEKELGDKNAPVCQPIVTDQSVGSSESSSCVDETSVNGDEASPSAPLLACEVQNGIESCPQKETLSNECQPRSMEVTLEPDQTGVQLSEPEAPAQNDEESEFSEEEVVAVKRKRKKKASSDEDWFPQTITKKLTENKERSSSSEEDSGGDLERSDSDETSSSGRILRHLCTDCGVLHRAYKPHTCQHKRKPHVCNLCGRRYATEAFLKTHSKTVCLAVCFDSSDHRCWYCHAILKAKPDKLTHQQIHLNQSKPYQCLYCTRSFASNVKRKKHTIIHIESSKLCDICGISFMEKYQLERHRVVHTGEKPYKCSVCERSFNQSGHLRSHMRMHTGEKPYACPHCDKAFNHNVSLKSHVQRYHLSKSETRVDTSCDGVLKKEDTQKQQKLRVVKPKYQNRRTGRPLGRPKRSKEEKRKCSQPNSSRKN